MFKTMLLIKKKRDISREEFIDYYNNRHLPFMFDLLGNRVITHRRNYIVDNQEFDYRSSDRLPGWPGDFDVITEAFYKNREEADRLTEMCRRPEIYKKILEDEAHFIEPGGVKRFIVEVNETLNSNKKR